MNTETEKRRIKNSRAFNTFMLVFGILCILYWLGMGLAVRFGQSLLFLWPCFGVFCIGRWYLVKKSLDTGKPLPFPGWLIIAFRICVALALAFFIFVECFVVSGSFKSAPENLDCVIVRGARVNGTVPSGSLYQRTEAAAEYLLRNPDTVCIASGGQGDGEDISEAECIKRGLAERGIEPGRIITEDRSTSTNENFKFSLELLPEGTENIGIVTNDFHIFRALKTADQYSSLSFSGIPAKSTVWGYIHYAMREFAALVVNTLNGELTW